jgi:alkylated DNA repair protein (DNA oxidative demethylase)
VTSDLFANSPGDREVSGGAPEVIGPRAVVLRRFALPFAAELLAGVEQVERDAPFRHMVTPGGFTMSVALTNCGSLGWTTDRRGYRYTSIDPQTGNPWPGMRQTFARLARVAASAIGFAEFEPDACLMNRYRPGSKMSLHQDKDERDFSAPIVSVSLGMDAIFLFGGRKRADRAARIPLQHGDVVVWGGEDRLRYHGVLRLEGEPHPLLGAQRLNLTFRKAG